MQRWQYVGCSWKQLVNYFQSVPNLMCKLRVLGVPTQLFAHNNQPIYTYNLHMYIITFLNSHTPLTWAINTRVLISAKSLLLVEIHWYQHVNAILTSNNLQLTAGALSNWHIDNLSLFLKCLMKRNFVESCVNLVHMLVLNTD